MTRTTILFLNWHNAERGKIYLPNTILNNMASEATLFKKAQANSKGGAANRTTTHKAFGELKSEVDVAEIRYHDGPLLLPLGMSLKAAVAMLVAREDFLMTTVDINETFDVFPMDGANALTEVMTEMYGWAPATPIPGFFGDTPPQLIRTEVAPGVFKEVQWGRFTIPGGDGGFVQTSAARGSNGRFSFVIHANVLRKDEDMVRSLFHAVREYLKVNSIYRGQAIKIRFRDDHGKPLAMPEPSFMDTSKINPDGLIYSDEVQRSVEVNLFTPIQRVQDLLLNGMSVKRGILLGGTFGTGKTLAATVASKHAVDNGITYVYVPRADELSDAIQFAKQYQSPACVVFCEDIDRALNGERSVAMDDILNIIDGIDTKHSHIITVLTTNDLKGIHAAMLRPGRLDAVIEVLPPDAKAVERLLRFYAGPAIAPETNLEKAGLALDGNIPAVIAEVIKRAKLAQLMHQPAGQMVNLLSEDAVCDAALSMASQLKLLAEQSAPPAAPPTLDMAFRKMVGGMCEEKLSAALEGREVYEDLAKLKNRMGIE